MEQIVCFGDIHNSYMIHFTCWGWFIFQKSRTCSLYLAVRRRDNPRRNSCLRAIVFVTLSVVWEYLFVMS
jgi:hypothetical protein